ncbi:MAG: hypothetical protein IKT09_08740 [Synergistes sp.]|nr:hypothetical protein [Synergistes sp.]
MSILEPDLPKMMRRSTKERPWHDDEEYLSEYEYEIARNEYEERLFSKGFFTGLFITVVLTLIVIGNKLLAREDVVEYLVGGFMYIGGIVGLGGCFGCDGWGERTGLGCFMSGWMCGSWFLAEVSVLVCFFICD